MNLMNSPEDPQFPHGKLNPQDEGSIEVGIATDYQKGVIVIQYPKPVKWLAMPLKEATEFRDLLNRHLDYLGSPSQRGPSNL